MPDKVGIKTICLHIKWMPAIKGRVGIAPVQMLSPEVVMSSPLDRESKSIIENTLLRFIAESYEPSARHQRVRQGHVDCLLHWGLLAQLGVLGLPFEEAFGGLGGASADIADAVTVLAKGLIFEPFIESAVIAGTVLARGRDPEQRGQAVTQAIEGASVTAMLGGRSGVPDQLSFKKTPEGYRLSGNLSLIPFAEQADFWLLMAVDSDGTPAIFRVPRSETRAHVASYRLMDGKPAADIRFDDTAIPLLTAWVQGEAAREAMDLASRRAVSAYCADAVGVMALLLEVTGEYLRTRVQFGVAIGTFQALQHRYADMHMGLVQAQAITRELAGRVDAATSGDHTWLCFAASSVVERAAKLVGQEAIQMHGGMGVTDELIVSHCNARLVVLTRLIRAWVDQSAASGS
ncbi:acyl-CoA dehydrogenase family protein [Trinickia symbiotica]|uniref:acyl-CoA dehydrogenase family protein n=1 Tax=Trinickia symbiotica TaxID=863227 RepID=UPI0015E79C72|nr:acyl-CoA dehydrogenase family protein [Trinickia symbiotica]